MLKKTITYKDFNDEEVTEDHFFHLSKAELVELEMSMDGGLSTALENIIKAQDGKAIIAEFKKIVLGAYGKKSTDGRRFVKTQELRDEFESSEAYSTLFMELVTDAGAAAEFVNGIVPQGLTEDAAKITQLRPVPDTPVQQNEQLTIPEGHRLPDEPIPELEPKVGTITRAEFQAMDQHDLERIQPLLASGELKLVE